MPTQSPNPARAQVPLRQVKHKQQRPMWQSPGRKFKFINQKDIDVRLCGALLITPPSSSTVAEQYNTNVDVVPPSIVPGIIFIPLNSSSRQHTSHRPTGILGLFRIPNQLVDSGPGVPSQELSYSVFFCSSPSDPRFSQNHDNE